MQGQVIDPRGAHRGRGGGHRHQPARTAVTDVNGVFVFPELRQRVYTLEAQGRGLYAGPVSSSVSSTGEPVVLRARPATRWRSPCWRDEAGGGGARRAAVDADLARRQRRGRGWRASRAWGRASGALRVEAAGFAPAAQMVVTEAGPATQRLVVRLEAGLAASGRVLDPAGARRGRRAGLAALGLGALPHHRSGVRRRHQRRPGPLDHRRAGARLVPVPGPAPRLRAGGLVPGARRHAPVAGIDLRLENGGQVTGRVLGADGKPVADAEVRAAALSGMACGPTCGVFHRRRRRFPHRCLPHRTVHLMALHGSGSSAVATADLGAARERLRRAHPLRPGEHRRASCRRSRPPLPEALVTARSTTLWTKGPIKAGTLTRGDLRGIPTWSPMPAGASASPACPKAATP
jgi:hypothetical protein